jgi:hypothetical protein
MAPLWNTFGRLVEPFWLAFSAFERLEPQREPFQPQFYDCWMDVFSLSSSLSRGWLVRAFERSEAERGRCWLDVWMDVWMDGWMDCWMDVFSLFSTSLCFPFLHAQVFIDFGLISGPNFESFSSPLDKNRCICSCLFPGRSFSDTGV